MNFFPSRGCVYKVDGDAGSQGKGFYDVEGLDRGDDAAPTLIQGVEFTLLNLVQQVTTLDNSKILYVFGTGFGNMVVLGEMLLGPSGGGAAGFGKLESFFEEKQVAKSKGPVSVSCPGGKGYSMYLHGINLGRVDPEFHVQPFALIGVVAAKVGG